MVSLGLDKWSLVLGGMWQSLKGLTHGIGFTVVDAGGMEVSFEPGVVPVSFSKVTMMG